MCIGSTIPPFPQSTRRLRLTIDFYACAITLFVLDYSSRLRGALHRRVSSRRQLRGKGAAALVAGVFLDEVFLVQLRVFCGHDCKRASVRLSGWRVDDPTVSLGDRTGLQRSWHVGWSIRFHEYSPGFVSSILMWMNLYFVVRYPPAGQAITSNIWIPAVVIGGAFTLFLMLYFPFVKGRQMRRP